MAPNQITWHVESENRIHQHFGRNPCISVNLFFSPFFPLTLLKGLEIPWWSHLSPRLRKFFFWDAQVCREPVVKGTISFAWFLSAVSQKKSDFPEISCLIPSVKGFVAFEQTGKPISQAHRVCILRVLWDSVRASRPEHVWWLLFQMKELVCLCFNYLFLQDLPSSIAPHGLKDFN